MELSATEYETRTASTTTHSLECPLCDYAWRGGPVVCHSTHAPILISWQWDTVEEYEAWYADAEAYCVDEQIANGQRPMRERFGDAFDASLCRLGFMRSFVKRPDMTLLDVGAGEGAFVAAAHRAGLSATGIDPTPRQGVLRGRWSDVVGQWDFITLHDVFEHLVEPRACLKHLRGCLAPNGLLIIETPEWDGPHQRKCGWEWRHIRPRQHVCLYSRGAAETLYDEEGLETVLFYRPLMGDIGKMTYFLRRS